MKKLKTIAAVIAVSFALLLCVDDSISFYTDIEMVQIPFGSIPDGSFHHHVLNGDHFFQKYAIPFSALNLPNDLHSLTKVQPVHNYHFSSIWQPPKKSC